MIKKIVKQQCNKIDIVVIDADYEGTDHFLTSIKLLEERGQYSFNNF